MTKPETRNQKKLINFRIWSFFRHSSFGLKKFYSKRNKGFTLIEVLTVVFLGSLIIMAAYSVYLMSYKSYKKQSEMAELTQNARIALERMSREIRQANEIVITVPPYSSAEIKFQDGHAPTPIQYIDYYLSGTDLKRRVSHYSLTSQSDWVKWSTVGATEHEDSNQIIAQQISALQFTGTNPIIINLSVSDGKSTYQFETKTLVRNAQ